MNPTIYYLVNPIDNSVFYIGATTLKLKHTLNAHCSKMKCYVGKGYTKEKDKLLIKILKYGSRPQIFEITQVPIFSVDHCEKFYYRYFTELGFELLQAPHGFTYLKNKRKLINQKMKKLRRKELSDINKVMK